MMAAFFVDKTQGYAPIASKFSMCKTPIFGDFKREEVMFL